MPRNDSAVVMGPQRNTMLPFGIMAGMQGYPAFQLKLDGGKSMEET
jgi:hypothetical protein